MPYRKEEEIKSMWIGAGLRGSDCRAPGQGLLMSVSLWRPIGSWVEERWDQDEQNWENL